MPSTTLTPIGEIVILPHLFVDLHLAAADLVMMVEGVVVVAIEHFTQNWEHSSLYGGGRGVRTARAKRSR